MVGKPVEEFLHPAVGDVLEPLGLDAALHVAPDEKLLHVGPEGLLAVRAFLFQPDLDGVVDVVVIFLNFVGLAAQKEEVKDGRVIPPALRT